MTILTARRGSASERDHDVMRDLFFCGALTIEQIAELHFARTCTTRVRTQAKNRLYELKGRGYLDNEVVYADRGAVMNFFYLTRQAHERKARDLWTDLPYRGAPGLAASKAPHFRDTNQLYVLLREELDALLGGPPADGGPPGWIWSDERASQVAYVAGNREEVHRPDARLTFAGHHFVIERQTKRARATRAEIWGKVEKHKAAMSLPGAPDPSEVELLFACDEPRDADSARRAAGQHGVAVYADTPEKVVSHVVGAAMDVRAHLEEQDAYGANNAR